MPHYQLLGPGRFSMGEFQTYNPDKGFAALEEGGQTQWKGNEAQLIIPRTDDKQFIPPMKPYFDDLLKRCWKKAQVSANARQQKRRVLIGQGRSMRPESPYRPIVNPIQSDKLAQIGKVLPTVKGYTSGVVSDWNEMKEVKWITAFSFRGDSRPPDLLKQHGGFKPPVLRTDDSYLGDTVRVVFEDYMKRQFGADVKFTKQEFLDMVRETTKSPEARKAFFHYSIWRELVLSESLHLGRMLAEETLKGYISTSRAMSVAKGYAGMAKSGDGYVYVLLVKGGILVPQQAAHKWTQIFGEQEIAYPGALEWPSVYGFRRTKGNKFDPEAPIYMRTGFLNDEPAAFKECFELLSGKRDPAGTKAASASKH